MATKKASAVDVDEERWRAESDLRTLMEAEAIKKDKPRLARAQAKAKEQLAALQAATSAK